MKSTMICQVPILASATAIAFLAARAVLAQTPPAIELVSTVTMPAGKLAYLQALRQRIFIYLTVLLTRFSL